MENKHAIIVGAGLVGSLWAVLLAKRGYRVDIYERRGDMRQAGFVGGRSINLALSDRGWRALRKAGIAERIREHALPMSGRMMHSEDGELTRQPYGREGQAIYSVSRGGLNLELIQLADEHEGVTFYFNHRCEGYERRERVLRFTDETTDTEKVVTAPVIFASDGAFSAVRSSLLRTPRFNYQQHYLDYGYKEISIPPLADGSHALTNDALHIWPRGQFMLIALPNPDGSFTGTLFLAYEGEVSFEHLQTDEQVQAFFEEYFGDVVPLMPELLQDFRENPTASLVTIRCRPWQYQEHVLLMGDASHAIVPFYGQGMNSGFEDCSLLDDLATEHNEDWPAILREFSRTRPDDADGIADLALRNFIEMRDWVGHPDFLLRKKIAARLQEELPDEFLPLYSMVTFSHTPYGEANREAKAQDELFERILAIPEIESRWRERVVIDEFRKWQAERTAQAV